MEDAFRREIKEGDLILYFTRRQKSSTPNMIFARVKEVGAKDKHNKYLVARTITGNTLQFSMGKEVRKYKFEFYDGEDVRIRSSERILLLDRLNVEEIAKDRKQIQEMLLSIGGVRK